jgi:hypothetical protein
MITHQEGKAVVNFEEPRFRELLKEYGGSDEVLDKIIADLKKELLKV